MTFRFRSIAVVLAVAGHAQAATSGDDKPSQFLIGAIPASAWVSPALLTAAPPAPAKAAPSLAGFLPSLPSSFFGSNTGSSHLLFLSPLSPLRAALRVAAQDLAAQTLTAFQTPAVDANDTVTPDDPQVAADAAAASRRREVLLRQRRKSVLNERENGVDRTTVAESSESELDLSGLSGRVELLSLPSGASGSGASDHAIPGGAGSSASRGISPTT